MNTHSSTHAAPASGTTRPPLAAQKKAGGEQDGDGSFASHVDADHVPPAQAARTALEGRPDLAGRPFGAIVSLFARHRELPAEAGAAPADPPQGDEPAVPEAEEAETADQVISG